MRRAFNTPPEGLSDDEGGVDHNVLQQFVEVERNRVCLDEPFYVAIFQKSRIWGQPDKVKYKKVYRISRMPAHAQLIPKPYRDLIFPHDDNPNIKWYPIEIAK